MTTNNTAEGRKEIMAYFQGSWHWCRNYVKTIQDPKIFYWTLTRRPCLCIPEYEKKYGPPKKEKP